MKPKYCDDEKLRTWALGPGACDGNYEHCKQVIKFGKQEYCGYCPGRCATHQVIRTQAGCIWCKHSTKNLDCKTCAECLAAPTRINFTDIRVDER